jgi:predicted nucleotidyltransferase
MPDNLMILLKNYREQIAKIFGEYLTGVMLYGSYARGDFNSDSDMDIMILADVEPTEISYYADKVYDITYDFEVEYGIEINPSVQIVQVYNQWKYTYPFFANIEKDGVVI